MPKQAPKTKLVEKEIRPYLDENGKLTISKKAMATLIFHKHAGLFGTLEVVRAHVRIVTNRQDPRRKFTTDIPKQPSTIEDGLRKHKLMTELPKRKDVHLSKGKWLILCDIHFPDHDAQALALALEEGKKENVVGIVINGDMLDMYNVASFDREVARPTIAEEIEMGRNFFALLRETFGEIPIYYKFGNHEERLRRFILRNAREIEGMHGLRLEEQLQCNQFKIKTVGKEIIWAGKLAILHGHEFGHGIFAPVNPAMGAFNTAKSSVAIGHHHQTSEHMEGNLKGDKVVTFSIGCLSTLGPEYRPYGYTKWNLGFGIVDVMERGMFRMRNYRIVNGEVY